MIMFTYIQLRTIIKLPVNPNNGGVEARAKSRAPLNPSQMHVGVMRLCMHSGVGTKLGLRTGIWTRLWTGLWTRLWTGLWTRMLDCPMIEDLLNSKNEHACSY